MVPVAHIISGITFAFTFLVRPVSFVRPLKFRIFSDSFLITFLSPEIATTDKQVPFPLTRPMMPDLLLRIVLSVCAS